MTVCNHDRAWLLHRTPRALRRYGVRAMLSIFADFADGLGAA